MSVIRIEKTKNYTVMSNYHLKEKNMTLKAKGLLSVMLSLPDNWDYSIAGLVAICKENETAIKSALKELQQFGYVRVDKITPDKTRSGRFEYIYNVFEEPQQAIKKQDIENLPLEIQPVENHVQLNTNKTNTNKLNTKNIKEKNTKKKSKIDTKLDNIARKCLEYDLEDDVIDLLDRFFRNLLEEHKMVTDDKVRAILTRLARVDRKTQLDAIQLSLDKGYMNIDPDWLKLKSNPLLSRLPQELILNGTTTDESRENYRTMIQNNDPSIKHF